MKSTPKTIWTKSPWTYKDLDQKSVEFKIHVNKRWIHGIGKFVVSQNQRGWLSVGIEKVSPKSSSSRVVHLFPIPQDGVDMIEKHPDQTVAHFRLFYSP